MPKMKFDISHTHWVLSERVSKAFARFKHANRLEGIHEVYSPVSNSVSCIYLDEYYEVCKKVGSIK